MRGSSVEVIAEAGPALSLVGEKGILLGREEGEREGERERERKSHCGGLVV